jgi:hypothetical protein
MSGAIQGRDAPGRRARPVLEVLLSAAGLAIWAGHFGAIYATNAVACERGLAGTHLFGLPVVPALVAGFTILALVGLGLVLRQALAGLEGSLDEGGETEPRFTRWFTAATAALAGVAVLFQAVPALILPPCG